MNQTDNNNQAHEMWDTARPHYTKLERNRAYALDGNSTRSLSAVFKASQELRGDKPAQDVFAGVLGELAKVGANVLQSAPAAEPEKPALWVDDVTGATLPSPFDISDEAKRRRECALLAKADPKLYEHFKAMHESPYGTVLKNREAESKRLREKAIKYGGEEHATNVFLHGSETEQAKFLRDHPELAAVHRRESKPVSLALNLTQKGQLTKNPKVAAIVERAREIEHEWKAIERAQLRRDMLDKQSRLEALGEPASVAVS
jgi:hypothetical protein